MAALGSAMNVLMGMVTSGQTAYLHLHNLPATIVNKEVRVLTIIHVFLPGSAGVLGKMAALGFPEDAFVGVVTSGEIAHLRLENRRSGGWFWEELGSRCLHMTWSERGAISLDGLGLDVRLSSPLSGFQPPIILGY